MTLRRVREGSLYWQANILPTLGHYSADFASICKTGSMHGDHRSPWESGDDVLCPSNYCFVCAKLTL